VSKNNQENETSKSLHCNYLQNSTEKTDTKSRSFSQNEIDTTGCEFLDGLECRLRCVPWFSGYCKNNLVKEVNCKDNPNCHYRQLQEAKKQIKLLERCLDARRDLTETLREDNERLRDERR